MNLPLFLYNFSKLYIPAVFILCLSYVSLDNLSKNKPVDQPKPIVKEITTQEKVTNSSTTFQAIQKKIDEPHPSQQNIPSVTLPGITQKMENPPQPEKIDKPQPVQPRYIYLVEFSSGKSMEVADVKQENKMVSFMIKDGYKMTVPENEIKSITKIRL